uniref:Mixed-linked glucanase n=1 Tax=Ganoderma boninense TaxID=34458 RepID=A0A5K1JXK4_9APHY|nr:Mixed-linked glucanase [Ganoderma boninense]
MFKAFTRTIPEISIFHNTSSPASKNALNLLRSAVSSPYPSTKPSAPPLNFNLEVIENQPPTGDQLRTILSYLPSRSPASTAGIADQLTAEALLSSHPTVESRPQDPDAVVALASKNPNALKWPIVVDWNNGRAAVGDIDGVKQLLEELRKTRDGEA